MYLAIGVPMIANSAAMLLGFTLISGNLSSGWTILKLDFSRRLDNVIQRLERIEGEVG